MRDKRDSCDLREKLMRSDRLKCLELRTSTFSLLIMSVSLESGIGDCGEAFMNQAG